MLIQRSFPVKSDRRETPHNGQVQSASSPGVSISISAKSCPRQAVQTTGIGKVEAGIVLSYEGLPKGRLYASTNRQRNWGQPLRLLRCAMS